MKRSYPREELPSVAKEVLSLLSTHENKATIVALYGELGAGKTTLVQAIASELGVQEMVTSPTFVIKKTYETNNPVFKQLVHMDAYRLEGEQNLEVFRLDQDFKNDHTVMIIEWPEIIRDIIPSDAIEIYIEHAREGRVIEIK